MSKKLVGIGAGVAVVAVAGTLAYRQYGGQLKAAIAAPAEQPAAAPAKVITLGAEAQPPVAPGGVRIAPVVPKQMPPKAADAKPKAPATQPAAAQPAPVQVGKAQAAEAKVQPAATKGAQPKKSKVISVQGTPQVQDPAAGNAGEVEGAPAQQLSPRDAERVALATLGAVRGQIALFTTQHNGTAPDFAKYPAFEQFLKPTAADGKVLEGQPAAGRAFGPYLRGIPVNPLNGRHKVKQVAGEVRPGQKVESADAGWVFSTASKRFYATDANGCVLDDVKLHAGFVPAAAGGKAPAGGTPAEVVQFLKGKIEQYRLHHNGRNPDLKKYPAWEQLTSKTKADGTIDANGEYGPYLFQPPVNPANGSSAVEVVARLTKSFKPKRPVGYVFESSTGLVHLTNEHGMLASAE